MIPFIKFMNEARRNANHPAQQRLSPVEQLEQYSGRSDIFITYTLLEKVGLNPKSKFIFEPLGVYTYPLDAVIDGIRKGGIRNVPYAADDAEFIYVLKPKGNILDVVKYTQNDFKRDIKKIANKHPKVSEEDLENYITFYDASYNVSNGGLGFDIDGDLLDPKRYPRFHKPHLRNRKHKLLYNEIGKKYPFVRLKVIVHRITENLYERGEVKSRNITFNKIYNKILGYDVLVDRSDQVGLIHENEKQQAVFLTKSSYEVVDKIYLNPKDQLNKVSQRELDKIKAAEKEEADRKAAKKAAKLKKFGA